MVEEGSPPGAWSLLRTGMFFGLATGFVESGIVFFREFVLHRFVWTPPFHLWTAPAIYALLFVVIGLVPVALKLIGVRITLRHAAYLYSFLGAWILTLPFPQIGRIAPLILAAGVAVQTGRIIAGHNAGFQRLVRTGSALMLAGVLVVAATMPLSSRAIERWRMAHLDSARPGAPNIVLIILDTVRAASLHLYGYGQPTTPHLDRWAARGVVFERAISPSSWTLPAHASLFTGRWVHELDVNFRRPLGRSPSMFTEVLRDHGYATGAFVGNDRYTFQDAGFTRGFARYDDYLFTAQEIRRSPVLMQTPFFRGLGSEGSIRGVLWRLKQLDFVVPEERWGQRKNAYTVSGNFVEWASSVKGRPFFAFLNYYDAHYIHRCPEPFRTQFNCKASRSNAYHGSIAYTDNELDKLFREMDRRGLLRNTIVIVTSDHGEQLGEHGLTDHGNSLYMQVLHVPLVAWGPGIPAGVRVKQAVSLRDVAATILDMAAASEPNRIPGASLATYWNQSGGAAPLDTATLYSQIISAPYLHKKQAGGDARLSIIRGDRHYILSEAGREELFNSSTDIEEKRNIKDASSERATLEWARHTVTTIANAQGARPSDTAFKPPSLAVK